MLGITGVFQGCKGGKSVDNTGVRGGDSTTFVYNLREAKTYVLPSDLDEISGIVWLNNEANTIYAVQDEDGVLFTYDMSTGQIVQKYQFGKKGDYEEVSSDGKFFFILKSNGSILTFPIDAKDSQVVKEHKGVIPKGEYEAMSFDSLTNKLYVLCKSCKEDKKIESTSGYILGWSPKADSLVLENTFSISIDSIKKLDVSMAKSFKPSAMARHPSDGKWYILSSIDKAIVMTDGNFVPKEIVRFDRQIFEQPEGIGFDSKSNMYISSEAGDKGQAILYQFLAREYE